MVYMVSFHTFSIEAQPLETHGFVLFIGTDTRINQFPDGEVDVEYTF